MRQSNWLFFCQTNWAKSGLLLQLSFDGVIKLYQVQCVPNYAFSQSNSYLSRDFAQNLSFAKIYSVSCSALLKLQYCLFLQMFHLNIMNDEKQKIQNNSPA